MTLNSALDCSGNFKVVVCLDFQEKLKNAVVDEGIAGLIGRKDCGKAENS